MVPTDPKGRYGPKLIEYISEPILNLPNQNVRAITQPKRLKTSHVLTSMKICEKRRRRSGRYFNKRLLH
ncbi:hypothetical protein GJ496_001217 [Pomphorhynchus laevis]|nr:hypothetical protein GJ496_001217 [Pomphorhynchus laevis]